MHQLCINGGNYWQSKTKHLYVKIDMWINFFILQSRHLNFLWLYVKTDAIGVLTINSDIFARILFSRIVLKDIFAT